MALRSFVRLSSLALLACAAPVSAQNGQDTLVPGLERFDLNTSPATQPAPRPTPSPRPTPTVRATPVPRATPTARATTTPRGTPTPRATPVPRIAEPVIDAEANAPADAAATPTPVPTPDVAVPPPPAPIEQPPVSASPTPAAPAPVSRDVAMVDTDDGISPWIILLGFLALIGAGAAGYVALQRRRQRPDDKLEIDLTEIGSSPDTSPDAGAADTTFEPRPAKPRNDQTPFFPDRPDASDRPVFPDRKPFPDRPADPVDLPPADAFPPAPPQSAEAAPSPMPVFINDTGPDHVRRARLELTVRPQRAGTNLTSAAVDYEIDIANTGDADATGIRLDLRLLSASADQDAILSALYAAPIDKPIVAPFEIPAGEQVSLGGMALLPNDALSIMTVQGRDFFVPLLSLNLVYGWGGASDGQTANAYVIGIERAGDAKMAPFRLDTGARMYDRVGARVHTLQISR